MTIDQLNRQFWFHDGSIKSFHLDISNNTAEIEINIRQITERKGGGQVVLSDFFPLKLTFHHLIEVSLFDRFPTNGYYISFSANSIGGHEVRVSFNVHDSSSHVYEKDNWVIKAKRLTWKQG